MHTWSIVRRKALRALNVPRELPVYPVLEDEKSKGSDKYSVKQKIALKGLQSNMIDRKLV